MNTHPAQYLDARLYADNMHTCKEETFLTALAGPATVLGIHLQEDLINPMIAETYPVYFDGNVEWETSETGRDLSRLYDELEQAQMPNEDADSTATRTWCEAISGLEMLARDNISPINKERHAAAHQFHIKCCPSDFDGTYEPKPDVIIEFITVITTPEGITIR